MITAYVLTQIYSEKEQEMTKTVRFYPHTPAIDQGE